MNTGDIYKFSDVLKMINLHPNLKKGCIVDTSVLFAFAYPNDRFREDANVALNIW